MDGRSLIYDWNTVDDDTDVSHKVELDDETLRDGIQSPSVTDPPIEDKIRLLHLMAELGIQSADIGLPAAGARQARDVKVLAKVIADEKLPIFPNCAARTVESDVDPIIEASQAAGIPIEASLFIGSSPVREYVEEWTFDTMLDHVEKSVRYARAHDLPVMFVTEDTTRANPERLRKLYSTAIACGAQRICLADTVGHATPHGSRMLVRHARDIVAESGEDIRIDWHGHNDRGMGLANSLAAAAAGADRLHGCGLGVGERCGNTAMELLLVNLRLIGYNDADLSVLDEYCRLISDSLQVPIPVQNPIVGKDAFRTATGVHAAAVIKAMKKGDSWLADRIYSSVPAEWVGRKQEIEIGPMSGASNVIHWLQSRGHEPSKALVARILQLAKESRGPIADADIKRIIKETSA